MPLPKSIAHFASHRFNPIASPIVRHLPGFAIVVHIGRKSGKRYETPIVAFQQGDTIVFALTYGPSADWVQNTHRRRHMHTEPARQFSKVDRPPSCPRSNPVARSKTDADSSSSVPGRRCPCDDDLPRASPGA